jgi:hypothetical protein
MILYPVYALTWCVSVMSCFPGFLCLSEKSDGDNQTASMDLIMMHDVQLIYQPKYTVKCQIPLSP